MKIEKINSFYIIKKLDNHNEIKDKILQCISELPVISKNTNKDVISNSDWDLPREHKREYLDIFFGNIVPYMHEMAEFLHCENWQIINAWFQQYNQSDKHEWHTHPDSNYTNVYYLELPDTRMKTQIFDVVDKKLIKDIEVQEGDILTFPAGMLHKSYPSEQNLRKTIISFNTSFSVAKNKELDQLGIDNLDNL